jgi:hypothetical protein
MWIGRMVAPAGALLRGTFAAIRCGSVPEPVTPEIHPVGW